ncbi:MAG: flagellar biosynthesis anti-sigma factor FlgM [Sphingomonadaceae bacterium]
MTTSRVTAGIKAPVDKNRVAEIRKALEDDRYPLVPTQIADAMIAAKIYGTIRK